MSNLKHQLIGIFAYSMLTFLCGIPQIWGNISLYIYSYFFPNDFDNDFGLINIAIVIELFLFLFGLLLFQILSDKIPHLFIMIFSIILITFFIFISSYIRNVYLFIFVFNALKGLFLGFIQTLPYKMGPELFNKDINKSRFKDFNLFFAGVTPFLVNFISPTIFNPENIPAIITDKTYMYFSKDVSSNFQNFLQYLALIYLIIGVLVILGLILTRNYKNNANFSFIDFFQLYKNNSKIQELLIQEHSNLDVSDERIKGLSFMKTVFSSSFLKIFFMAVFSSIFMEYFVIYYKEIGFSNYNNDEFLSFLGASCFLFFTTGKVFWKFLSNLLNNILLPLTIVIIIQSLIGFLFKFAAKSQGIFFFVTCLIFFIAGGQYVLYEKMVKRTFRESKYRHILTVFVNFAFVISMFIVVLIHYIFYVDIGFNNLIIVMTLLGFLSFIFFL